MLACAPGPAVHSMAKWPGWLHRKHSRGPLGHSPAACLSSSPSSLAAGASVAAHLAGGWSDPTPSAARADRCQTVMALNCARSTIPYAHSNDTVGQLHHQVQVRPHGHHHGVAAADAAAANTATAGTAAADIVAADTATACPPSTSPVPSPSTSTTCVGRLYTAGVRRVLVHRPLFPLSLYPYLLHLFG